MHNDSHIINGLSIDVEDYFHVSNFTEQFPINRWDSLELRVENNTRRLLELFERYSARATFFVLGWVAKKCPGLVKKIAEKGHEIACHSNLHRLVYDLTDKELKEDLMTAKKILEDQSGKTVAGFRAPSYSITRRNLHALDILLECGFTYDSSIFPVHHHRYGIPDFERFPTQVVTLKGGCINEYPISTLRIGRKNIPVGGGAYARIFPLWFLMASYTRINRSENKPFIFYLHPWEIDTGQPRVPCSRFTRFRHYTNIGLMEGRLEKIIRTFSFAPLIELPVVGTTTV